MVTYGYGKMLDVDLSTGKIEKTDIDPKFAREFIGGMGFSSKILFDQVGVDVEPYSPDNMVIFANGPLTGTGAPCASRTEITTKSPLTGTIGTGNTGGFWGTTLKHAGFDVIILRNKAEKPVYLWVDDDKVEIKDASHIWGKDTGVTSDVLGEELGSGVSVLTIGQAGENLVRYACPVNDYHHGANRSGAGAVMGDKKIKAIAVRGSNSVKIARPDEFREAAKEARDRIMTARKVSLFGSGRNPISWDARHGSLPGKNFQTGFFPNWAESHSRGAGSGDITRGVGTCWACPMSCFSVAEVHEGKYAGLKVGRPNATGVQQTFGAKCAIDDVRAIWKCKELCQKLGMDYASAAGCVAFAIELFQRKIITTDDADGLELSWGNEDAIAQVLQKIALREGIGAILAEGSVRAAAKLGRGAEKYTMTIKGMEIMGSDPRATLRGAAFGNITNPRGGDNIKSTHSMADEYNPDWWADQFDMFDDAKRAIYSFPPEEVSYSWDGKAMMCKWFEDLYSILNALGVCIFPSGFVLALGPTYLSKLYSACTGWDTTPEEIVKFGEKIFTLLKVYNVRQGLTRKDDAWPERFYQESLPDGPAKGARLSRDTVERLLDQYYELRGWDKNTGLPTRKRLAEFGLGEVADHLQNRVKFQY